MSYFQYRQYFASISIAFNITKSENKKYFTKLVAKCLFNFSYVLDLQFIGETTIYTEFFIMSFIYYYICASTAPACQCMSNIDTVTDPCHNAIFKFHVVHILLHYRKLNTIRTTSGCRLNWETELRSTCFQRCPLANRPHPTSVDQKDTH